MVDKQRTVTSALSEASVTSVHACVGKGWDSRTNLERSYVSLTPCEGHIPWSSVLNSCSHALNKNGMYYGMYRAAPFSLANRSHCSGAGRRDTISAFTLRVLFR